MMLVHLVGPVGIGHGGFERVQLGAPPTLTGPAPSITSDDRAAARHLAHVLAEVADGDAAIDGHLALVGLLLAGDHPEEGRLAGAVRPDETDLLALAEAPLDASMKRIWWPFCLLTFSRRIMCARNLEKLRRPYAMCRANGRALRTAGRPTFERERSDGAFAPGATLGENGAQLRRPATFTVQTIVAEADRSSQQFPTPSCECTVH